MTPGEEKVLADIREIALGVEEGAETPGGVEHTGDFRRLIQRRGELLAEKSEGGVST